LLEATDYELMNGYLKLIANIAGPNREVQRAWWSR